MKNNCPEKFWLTAEGIKIKISNMETSHLANAIALFCRKGNTNKIKPLLIELNKRLLGNKYYI